MDRIILGPTPTTYVVNSEVKHNGITYKRNTRNKLFPGLLATGEQLRALREGGAIGSMHPRPLSDSRIYVSWPGLEAVAGGTIPDTIRETVAECHRHGLIGVSPPMLGVIEKIAVCRDLDIPVLIAGEPETLDAPVLIAGEPKTEQEVVALCVHHLTQRAGEFVTIECDGFTTDQVQCRMKRALNRVGDSGTLFLKDIDKAPELQATVIEKIDGGVPVFASVHRTAKDLNEAVSNGEFLRDLFRTFKRGIIEVPPLCERFGDVPLLIHCFIERHNRGDFARRPEQAIESVTVQSLYVARRCRDIDELKCRVQEGCRRATAGCLNLDMSHLQGQEAEKWPAEVGLPDKLRLKGEELLCCDFERLLRSVEHVEGVNKVDLVPRAEEEQELQSTAASHKSPLEADNVVDGRCIFRFDRGQWHIVFAAESAKLDDRRGMAYIHYLLLHPNEPVHCSDLIAILKTGNPDLQQPRYSNMTKEMLEDYGLSPGTPDDLGEILSKWGIGTITDAIKTIGSFMESETDPDRHLELKREHEQLQQYLGSGTQIDGTPREWSRREDNQRTAVKHAIDNALKHIKTRHPELHEHLSASIKTGTMCVYAFSQPILWDNSPKQSR